MTWKNYYGAIYVILHIQVIKERGKMLSTKKYLLR